MVLGDRWRVLEVVDRWGAGLRFQAEDARSEHPSVLVEMLPLPAEGAASALDRPRDAAARLSEEPAVHGVLPVIASGREAPNILWRVTSPGGAARLSDLLAQSGPMDPTRAARLGIQLCDTLIEAHGRGVLHLGLDPASVVLDDAGLPHERLHLTDFGLGPLLGGGHDLAPELSRGILPDGRTDVWGVGHVLERVTDGWEPPSPRLDALVRRAKDSDPRNRPTALDGVRRELEAIVEGRVQRGLGGLIDAVRRVPTVALLYLLGISIGAVVVAGLGMYLGTAPAERDVQRGHSALASGDAASGVLAFERAASRDPGLPAAHLGLARAREALGLHVAAIEAWRGYLSAEPGSARAHLGLGRLLLQDGRLQEATRHADLAVQRAPANAATHALQGRARAASGDVKGAASALERAVALSPSDPDLHAKLGEVLAGRPERHERAREAFTEAVRLEPRRTARRIALADFLAEDAGDCLAAVPHYRATLAQDPARAAAERGLGRCLAKNPEDRGRAEVHLVKATELAPADAGYHLALARYRRDQGGGCVAARSALDTASRLAPDNTEILEEVAACREATKDWCGAEEAWRKLRSLESAVDAWRVHRAQAADRCRK